MIVVRSTPQSMRGLTSLFMLRLAECLIYGSWENVPDEAKKQIYKKEEERDELLDRLEEEADKLQNNL